MEQFIALRKHYLPHEPDTEENIAAAIWLDNRHWTNSQIAVANGIALAFKGDSWAS
ncbi:hypothetical protein KOL64_15660 [Providencia rettgeri]|uniref:Uncharacterized protein n=2 Tax=Morganellaceae TaxID=1903414 RepID=A0AAJ4NLI3_PRORE|nr:hypothetical protein [Providencia rettgeri]QWQ18910.2 hypothetical protein KOL65_15655 [Providencia rettgeri]QWQ22747.2 hypothetical protein KOF27_15675 [Providencia rettgeri]QWQ26585.2 hypothetical protein KOL64_15660 [Providencia rettgeri]